MTSRQLRVLVNDQWVGLLREQNDLWAFEYTPEWQASVHGYDLSPALSHY